MKKFQLFCIMMLMHSFVSYGQETRKILEEGQLLYRLEKASWYGTDDFLVRFPDKRDSIGGYLSYIGDKNRVVNIFFSKNNHEVILVRYSFDSIPVAEPLEIDSVNRTASQREKDLIDMRQDAVKQVMQNKDDFFSFYKNTSLNFIPLISEKERKVFILTGPQISGVVIIGNDYVLTYDKKNKFKQREKIHSSILQFSYASEDPENKLTSTYHSHVLSDCISSTDICTLLLYKEFVEWKQHYVVSKKYVSIFDLEKEELLIMTKEAWDKIGQITEEKLSE